MNVYVLFIGEPRTGKSMLKELMKEWLKDKGLECRDIMADGHITSAAVEHALEVKTNKLVNICKSKSHK